MQRTIFTEREGGSVDEGQAPVVRCYKPKQLQFCNDVVTDGTAGTYHSALREKLSRIA